MIRLLLVFIVFCVTAVWCQPPTITTVNITGNVTDPVTGSAYQNATGTATLISGNGQPASWTVNGTNPVRTPINTNLDSFGNFTTTLTNTCLIDQQGSQPQWRFSFLSAQYANVGQVTFTVPALALCSNQDITTQITAAPPAVLPISTRCCGVPGSNIGLINAADYPGADMCAKINAAFLANPGVPVITFTFRGNQPCASNPFANTTGDVLLFLGDVTVQTTAPWVTNSHFAARVVGTTRSNLVSGQVAGTRIQAVTGFPATCDGLTIGCPIFREGDASAGANGAFNHMIEHVALDCNNTGPGTAVAGIGLYSTDIQEQSGAMFFEIVNCPIYGAYFNGSGQPLGSSAQNFILEHGEIYAFSSSTTSTVGVEMIDLTASATNARIISDITVSTSNTVHGAAGFQFQQTNNGVLQGLNSEQFVTGYDLGPNSSAPVNGISLTGMTCGQGTQQCVWIHSGTIDVDLSTIENGGGNTTIRDDTAFPSGVIITDFHMTHYTTADSGNFRFNTSHYTSNSGNGNLFTTMFVRDKSGLSGFGSFTEAADFPAIVIVNSGVTAPQGQNLEFEDRGTLKWTIQNTGNSGSNTNAFQILDQNSNIPRLFFTNTVNNTGYSEFASAGVASVEVNSAVNSGTGGFRVWSGGTSPTIGLTVGGNGAMTWGGGQTLNSSNAVPSFSTTTVGQTVCIKSTGPPIQLGTCSTVVSSGGACTCN